MIESYLESSRKLSYYRNWMNYVKEDSYYQGFSEPCQTTEMELIVEKDSASEDSISSHENKFYHKKYC